MMLAIVAMSIAPATSFPFGGWTTETSCPACCNQRGWLPCGWGILGRPDSVVFGDTECCCPAGVASEDECAPNLETRSMQSNDVGPGSPLNVGGSDLPEALRGVFWLSGQGTKSSLITFAASSDGKSGGPLNNENQLTLKVYGDQTWVFADDGAVMDLVALARLQYKFTFNDAADPTSAQIHPIAFEFDAGEHGELLLDFDMSLVEGGDPDYPGSVIWRRVSSALGQQLSLFQYDMIQVMDEAGNRLPSFDIWLAYNADTSQTGNDPDRIFYWSSQPE